MEIIKFNNPTDPTRMSSGEIVDGFKSKMWIERFIDSGEFQLVADLDSGVREKLPIDTFITHTNSHEIMVVDDHEISSNKNGESLITITGTSVETILDRRVIAANSTYPTYSGPKTFSVSGGTIVSQIGQIITALIDPVIIIDTNDRIDYFRRDSGPANSADLLPSRKIPLDNGYNTVQELMEGNNVGIRTIRPGYFPGGHLTDTTLYVTDGDDRSNSVVFSHFAGDIESAKYLWSQKPLKNYAIVHGKWINLRVTSGTVPTGKDRRMLIVDASDLDQHYTSAPQNSSERTDIINEMTQRGREAIKRSRQVSIAEVELAKDISTYTYRKDYFIGDFVRILGEYGVNEVKQVVEHVEVEDENGYQAYPTLATL